ncbi:hypothetical protein [Spirosoma gilvum]
MKNTLFKLGKSTLGFLLAVTTCLAQGQMGKFFGAAKSSYGGEYKGYIVSSADGKTWSVNHKITDEALHAIAAGNGKIVAIGKNTVLTSADGGKTWKDIKIPGAESWFEEVHDIAFGGGLFVAVGTKETIIFSKDGENWTRWTNPDGNRKSFTHPDPTLERRFVHYYGVTFAKDRFILVGGSFRVATLLLNEGNLTLGKSQVLHPAAPPAMCRDVAYDGKSTVVMCGGSFRTYVSTDIGETWSRVEDPILKDEGTESVSFCNGKFVVTGRSGKLWTSADGMAFKSVPTVDTKDYLYDTAYGNGLYVAAGDKLFTFTSKDGALWKESVNPANDKNISIKRLTYVKL